MAGVQAGDPVLLQSEVGRRLYEAYQSPDTRGRVRSEVGIVWRDIGGALHQTIWNRVVAAAEEFNDPGRFTTLAGYEWSSRGSDDLASIDPALLPGTALTGNLHRVVIFKTVPTRPTR